MVAWWSRPPQYWQGRSSGGSAPGAPSGTAAGSSRARLHRVVGPDETAYAAGDASGLSGAISRSRSTASCRNRLCSSWAARPIPQVPNTVAMSAHWGGVGSPFPDELRLLSLREIYLSDLVGRGVPWDRPGCVPNVGPRRQRPSCHVIGYLIMLPWSMPVGYRPRQSSFRPPGLLDGPINGVAGRLLEYPGHEPDK